MQFEQKVLLSWSLKVCLYQQFLDEIDFIQNSGALKMKFQCIFFLLDNNKYLFIIKPLGLKRSKNSPKEINKTLTNRICGEKKILCKRSNHLYFI